MIVVIIFTTRSREKKIPPILVQFNMFNIVFDRSRIRIFFKRFGFMDAIAAGLFIFTIV